MVLLPERFRAGCAFGADKSDDESQLPVSPSINPGRGADYTKICVFNLCLEQKMTSGDMRELLVKQFAQRQPQHQHVKNYYGIGDGDCCVKPMREYQQPLYRTTGIAITPMVDGNFRMT